MIACGIQTLQWWYAYSDVMTYFMHVSDREYKTTLTVTER